MSFIKDTLSISSAELPNLDPKVRKLVSGEKTFAVVIKETIEDKRLITTIGASG